MKVKIIQTIEEFKELKTDWERIQKASQDITYYSTFEYNYLWWKHFGDNSNLELFIIVLEHEDIVIGIAPLFVFKTRKKLRFIKTLKFIGDGDFKDFLIYSNEVKQSTIYNEIFKAIEANKQFFDRINLTHISQVSNTANYVFKSKFNTDFSYLIETPYINLAKYNTFEDFMKNNGPKNVKKLSNKLRRMHDYKFIVQKGITSLQVTELCRLHIKEQKFLKTKKLRLERTSIFADETRIAFLSQLWSDNPSVVFFHILDKNNNLIAYDLCYEYKKIFHSWNMGYDPEFSSFSPGRIITYEIARYIIDVCNSKIFDMGSGGYAWKFEWTDRFILTYKLNINF